MFKSKQSTWNTRGIDIVFVSLDANGITYHWLLLHILVEARRRSRRATIKNIVKRNTYTQNMLVSFNHISFEFGVVSKRSDETANVSIICSSDDSASETLCVAFNII